AFSPDGTMLASTGYTGIVLWDVATRQPIGAPLTIGSFTGLVFGLDGKTLVSGGYNGVMLWNVDVKSWRERACSIANRNFTEAEWAQFFVGEPYRKTCANLS
ncbi:MAG TPA: WD40 repeat domain-containing protein, partial [Roseiflexaceae bacterium]|nr:WD40 repeat domain-containing protein [Roseiflexaceae bacterium]